MSSKRDYFLYSGAINASEVFGIMETISKEQESKSVTLILCTSGGSPDAAYKIGRYLQSRYEDINILISGLCKSAGTLLAISANELIFCPYGELGPLDIQMSKQDNLSTESGLNVIETMGILQQNFHKSFHTVITEIMSHSSGEVSFTTAARVAAKLVESMYKPMFSQIDPEKVGSRSRAMNIGEYYGNRLDFKFENLKNKHSMEKLSRGYPSHGFVIDEKEAKVHFKRIRHATDEEKNLVDVLGASCRFPSSDLIFKNISCKYEETRKRS